jgi:Spy/CpxP family protein refolding chaperone
MKKLFVLAVVAVVALGAASVYADGGGCCSGAAKSSAKGGCCNDMLSKLNLTPEQKAKIETLRADTRKATSTSESHQMFSAGLEKILTPEQLAQLKTQGEKTSNSGGCPFMNSTKTNKQT